METNWNEPQVPLPNASVILVLGIISIVGCCCTYGIVGIVCGIIALVLAKSASDLYASDPRRYTQKSYSNMSTGKICAIIGLVLSAVFLIRVIWIITQLGWSNLTDLESLQERLQEILNQR